MLDGPYAPAVGYDFRKARSSGNDAATATSPTAATSTTGVGKDRMSYNGKPVFALSGVTEQVRTELIEKIQQMNADISNKPNEYDPACTHILCTKPNRGEKILSGIAAGKWLLCTKYINDSCEAGYFLNVS